MVYGARFTENKFQFLLFVLHALKGLVDSLTWMKVFTTGNWAKMDFMIPNTFYKM